MTRNICLLAFVAVIVSQQTLEAADFLLPFNAVFHRQDPGAPVIDAVPFGLDQLGISQGDVLYLERLGGFSWAVSEDDNTAFALAGVFSSSSTLLSNDTLNRVPGAIDAGGPEVFTDLTFSASLTTDIPEDFLISAFFDEFDNGVFVEVPLGATHLFVAAYDSGFCNNQDLNGDFGVRVELVPESADFDEDGDVDGIDFLSWQRGFGTVVGAGDMAPRANGNANGDQFIDGEDLSIWEAQYGMTGLPTPLETAAFAVPEPTCMALVLSCLLLCSLRERHASSSGR